MGQLKDYFFGKLSTINYEMAIHEGDANRRLASQSVKIMLLPKSEVPEKFTTRYSELRELVETALSKLSAPGLIPIRLHKIQNRTAVKYIKLLYEIEEDIKDQ